MRLFLAIELPAETRRELRQVQSDLERCCRGWRWTRPEGIHLTLRFLGSVEDAVLERQCDRWRPTVAGQPPVRLRPGGLGTFPERGTPRVLWLAARESGGVGHLAQLAAALEQTARELGFAPERRPFRPHLTLARARKGARPDRPPADCASALGEIEADAVVLFRSELSPSGARYTALREFPLAAAGPSS